MEKLTFKQIAARIVTFRKKARHSLKRNYAAMIAVCFFVAVVTGHYSTSMAVIHGYDADMEQRLGVVGEAGTVTTNSETLWDVITAVSSNSISNAGGGNIGIINTIIDAATRAQTPAFRFVESLYSFIVTHRILHGIFLLIGLALFAAYTLFVTNVLTVGEKRYMLEAREFSGTKIRRLFSLYPDKTVINATVVILLRDVKMILWACTIVYGPVKFYEYRMIPYILAETPGMAAKDVFARSKQLTNGHKWELFLLDVSFAGWWVLSLATAGILSWLFVNPYRTAAEAELYKNLCGETQEITSYPENPYEKLDKVRHPHFMADADRSYSLISYILLFFTFSIAGWLWEVALELVTNGILVNRGVLTGPWLPIYGSAGVAMLIVLKPIRKNAIATFFSCMAISGVIEYFTSWALQMTKGVKWWDYSGYFLNINGRICLEGLVAFGIGGSLFIYFLAPVFDDLYKRIPRRAKYSVCAVLIALFAVDLGWSHFHPNTGKGITDYGTQTQNAEKAGSLHDSSYT